MLTSLLVTGGGTATVAVVAFTALHTLTLTKDLKTLSLSQVHRTLSLSQAHRTMTLEK
jgi:hypothetical protein